MSTNPETKKGNSIDLSDKDVDILKRADQALEMVARDFNGMNCDPDDLVYLVDVIRAGIAQAVERSDKRVVMAENNSIVERFH
jgi:hypothetical protein